MQSTLAKNEILYLIDGPAGKLEMARAQVEKERGAWGIICHPHPLYGGNMNNKIVTTLARSYQDVGVNTIRFNFRGVGKSEGRYDQGEGELYDLLTVINWVLKERADQEVWLAGFSFGGSIAIRAAAQIPLGMLVTVAPAITKAMEQKIEVINSPWILVHGEKDDVIPSEPVIRWAEAQKPSPVIIRFPEAGHFFHGQLTELRVAIIDAIKKILSI